VDLRLVGVQRRKDPYTGVWPPIVQQGQTIAVEVNVAHWAVASPAALVAAICWLRGWKVGRRVRRNRCRTCDYDLTGNLSGVCPECGRVVDVATTQSAHAPSQNGADS
jgi:hypothetical protein